MALENILEKRGIQIEKNKVENFHFLCKIATDCKF